MCSSHLNTSMFFSPPIILQLGAATYFINFHFIENSCVSQKKVGLEQHEGKINEKFSFLDAILL